MFFDIHPMEFWLHWFGKQGIKLGSAGYQKLGRVPLSVLPRGNKWPWGGYETEDLCLLAQAARKFWSNYVPGDPETAPRNEDVEQWLRSQGIADRKAQVIATLLRADDVPAGRRKSK